MCDQTPRCGKNDEGAGRRGHGPRAVLADGAKSALKAPIRLYQLVISPLFPPSCRFHPTCSAYAMQALERHGVVRGGVLAARRLLSCHPFHKGHWHDPVPERFDWRAIILYKRKHTE